jgi:hypothetical protein
VILAKLRTYVSRYASNPKLGQRSYSKTLRRRVGHEGAGN